MRIAFYAPLKPPTHETPSGDRAMARLLMEALRRAGHQVELASKVRAFLPDPTGEAGFAALMRAAAEERLRLARLWRASGPPDLWFCYHPYYKSPDLIGPGLAQEFDLPWVSAEASLSRRRDHGIWESSQTAVAASLAIAAMNFTLTARDREGLRENMPQLRVCALPPFLDARNISAPEQHPPGRLVAVAMMRPGDKMDSYRALAASLRLLPDDLDWRLAIAGDGPMRAELRAAFPQDRVDWLGALGPGAINALLGSGSIYVWPGCGEAYGLAYLEAQAAGLPVVAWATAGVPEVVADGETGLLAPDGDIPALARRIARLLSDHELRQRMGRAARARVLSRHDISIAAEILDRELRKVCP